jgi:hypothetical protein
MENEMDAELRFHIESYGDDLIRAGISREEALRRARLQFGGLEQKNPAAFVFGSVFLFGVAVCAGYGPRAPRVAC